MFNALTRQTINAKIIKSVKACGLQFFHFYFYPESEEMFSYNKSHGIYTSYTDQNSATSGSAAKIVDDFNVKLKSEDRISYKNFMTEILNYCATTNKGNEEAIFSFPGTLKIRHQNDLEYHNYEKTVVVSRHEHGPGWLITGHLSPADRLVEAEKKAKIYADYDSLTNLYSESFILRYAEGKLCEDRHCVIGLFEIDKIYDIEGDVSNHSIDLIQVTWANKLRESFGGNWIVGRVRKGVFAVIKDNASKADVCLLKNARKELSSCPVIINQLNVARTASCGILFYESGKNIFANLLQRTERCLVEAQKRGGNSTFEYTVSFKHQLERERTSVISPAGIVKAYNDGKIKYFKQPIFDTQSRKIFGNEALLRVFESGSAKGPDYFLDMLYTLTNNTDGYERISFMKKQLDIFLKTKEDNNLLFVNMDEQDFLDGTCEDFLKSANEIGLANKICIEIIEEPILKCDSDLVISDAVDLVHRLGALVALDDFGKHNSSLSRLAEAPFDFVKIDKTLTQKFRSKGAKMILKSLQTLSEEMSFTLIAEGIECDEAAAWFTGNGIYLQQGFFWGKPQP